MQGCHVQPHVSVQSSPVSCSDKKTAPRLLIPTRDLEMISINSCYHPDLLVRGAIKMRLRAIPQMPATISQLCFALIHSSEALLLSPLGEAMATADRARI